jgi:putative transposase
MSRQARQQSNTGVYHVIQRGVNRMLIFHEDADRRMFLDLLKSQAGEFFKVYCFCLMDSSYRKNQSLEFLYSSDFDGVCDMV